MNKRRLLMSLVELNMMAYPRVVRRKVMKKMGMMVTQPNPMIRVERKQKMIFLVQVYSMKL